MNLILGQSTSVTDIDYEALEKECSFPFHWYYINGTCSSFVKMERAISPLFRTGLRANICLLAIDPICLSGQPSVRILPDHTKQVNIYLPIVDVKFSNVWIMKNKRYVSTLVDFGCDTVRAGMMNAMNLPEDIAYEPDLKLHNPVFNFPGLATPQTLSSQLHGFEAFGAFSAESYRLDSEQANALLRVIHGCQRISKHVVVVNLPSSSMLISRVPSVAEEYLEKIIARARRNGPLTFFNLRRALPPDLMYDYIHLNSRGKSACTSEIAQRLKSMSSR